MLPTATRSLQRPNYVGHYLRRLLKPKQMDFEYTFWTMLQLVVSPRTAYRHTAYHKQTKNHWARDDPAFLLVMCLLVMLTACAYCIALSDSFSHAVMTVVSAVMFDFLLLGCAIATTGWLLSNNFLRKRNLQSHQVEQHVEWLYAFDVHCNSYFPLFLSLYVLQLLLSPILLWRSFLSTALSTALYAGSLGYYHYMTFLGYSSLPFLEHTEAFLWPIGLIFLSIPFAILSGFNPARFTLSIYFGWLSPNKSVRRANGCRNSVEEWAPTPISETFHIYFVLCNDW